MKKSALEERHDRQLALTRLANAATAAALYESDDHLGKLSQEMQAVATLFPQVSMREPEIAHDPQLVEAVLLFVEFTGNALTRLASYARTGDRAVPMSMLPDPSGALAGVFATLDVLVENGLTTEDTIRKRALGVFAWLRQRVKHATVPADPPEPDEPTSDPEAGEDGHAEEGYCNVCEKPACRHGGREQT